MDCDDRRAGLILVSGGIVILSLLAIIVSMSGSSEGAEPRSKAPVAVISHPKDLDFFLGGTEIEFNGSSSYDPDGDIVKWTWYFGDGFPIINGSPTVFHSFNDPSRYQCQLMVTDDTGETANASITVVISNTTGPQPNISMPQRWERCSINQIIQFSPNGSIDPAGGNLAYHWDFGDNTTSDDQFPSHRYNKIGRYHIELQAENDTGSKGFTSIYIHIRDDIPAVVISSPMDGGVYNIRDEITFSADGTYDPDGDITHYFWYFGDSSRPGYNSTGPFVNITYKYPKTGYYAIRLDVMDADTNDVTATVHITITDQNRPPVIGNVVPVPHAYFHTNMTINFSAADCYDPDGDDLNYTWWWEHYAYGPGGVKVGLNSTGIEVNRTYSEEGIYTVILTVRDEGGLEAEKEFYVKVWNDGWIGVGISAPVNETKFKVGQNIAFSGFLKEYDITRPFLKYTWDFGDGTNASGLEANHSYSTKGRYTVTLWILDGLKTDKDTVWFDVGDEGTAAKISLVAKSGLEGSDWLVANETVRFSIKGLNASFPGKDRIVWEFGDGTVDSGLTPEHVYAQAGKYHVTVTIPDSGKNTTLSRVLTVHSTPLKPASGLDPTWLALGVGLVALAGVFVFFGATELGVYSLFSFLVFLYTKIKREEVLDNYVRGQIHGYIVANPGDHYNSILKALKLNNGTLAWHIRKLEDEGVVKARTDGIHKRFYPSETVVPEPDGGAMTEVQRMIMAKVAETPGISQKDIAGLLKVSGSTVNYHIGTLVGQGKVRQERDGMRVRYFATELAPHDGEKELRNDAG